jgi:hypothetical protein
MKNEGGREAGYFSKMVPDRGDRCLFDQERCRCANNFFRVRSATPIGAGRIGAPIGVAYYKEDDCVRYASPIFIPIAY